MANSDVRKVERETPGRPAAGAIERAFLQWHAILIRAVTRQFGLGPPDPEEAVQTAFTRFANLDDPDTVIDTRAYLFTVARNYVLDYRRKAARHLAAQGTVEILAEGDGPANLDTERVLIARERLAIIDSTLASMDPRKREVLVLRMVDGLGWVEIAERMNLSVTRVRQVLAATLSACTIALAAADMSEED